MGAILLKPEFVESINQLTSLSGGEAARNLCDNLTAANPSVAVRLNRRKATGYPAALRPVPWALGGYYIDGERPRFTLDPALHQGVYYVQDPSSMVVGKIVGDLTSGKGPLVAIDACAAPGGKTTAAIDALPDGSLMIANEYDYSRAAVLKENLVKWGYPAVIVSRGDTRRLAETAEYADIILTDVPCSGEGMMRKDADAVAQWSSRLVDDCAAVQRDIVRNLWPALKPGGYLVYSTCTFNTVENERNIIALADELGAEIVDTGLSGANGVAGAIGHPVAALRFFPGRVDGEGLFVAVMRKPGAPLDFPIEANRGKKGKKDRVASKKEEKELSALLSDKLSGDFAPVTCDGRLIAVPSAYLPLYRQLSENLEIIHAGVEIGEMKGRDLIPSQSLAMSTALRPDAFHSVETDYATAITYLQRQTVTLPEDAPKGIVLLVYRGKPLGFVKNIGNRSNNLYPKEYAIRTTHLLDAPVEIF